MRVKEEHKKVGKFWIPTNENNKAHGTLFIKDGGEIELELADPLSSDNYIRRIVGQVEGVGPVTLDKCFERGYKNSHGITKNIFNIDRAFFGVHYADKEELYFNSFCFSIERLHQWVGIKGVKINDDIKPGTFTIKYTKPEKISYKIMDNDIQLIFQFNNWSQERSNEKDKFTVLITEKTHINLVSSNKLPLEKLISIARKITNLICFAMNNVVCINDVAVATNEKKGKNNELTYIKLYYRSRPFAKNTDGRNSYLFEYRYNEIKQNMDKIINDWLNISDKIYPAFELYFSTQEGKHQFLESRFLTLVQSLEAYHQRESCNDDKTLRERIEEIIDPFKGYIGNNGKCEKIIQSIIDTRNYFTHYNPKKEQKASKGQELYSLCLILEALFQLTLLEKLGIPSQRVKFIASQILQYKLKNNFLPT